MYGNSIRERNEFSTGTGDGKIPFISAEDIADAALEALITDKIAYEDLVIVGPELFTYDEVACHLGTLLISM